jgi:hypothetical protein
MKMEMLLSQLSHKKEYDVCLSVQHDVAKWQIVANSESVTNTDKQNFVKTFFQEQTCRCLLLTRGSRQAAY